MIEVISYSITEAFGDPEKRLTQPIIELTVTDPTSPDESLPSRIVKGVTFEMLCKAKVECRNDGVVVWFDGEMRDHFFRRGQIGSFTGPLMFDEDMWFAIMEDVGAEPLIKGLGPHIIEMLADMVMFKATVMDIPKLFGLNYYEIRYLLQTLVKNQDILRVMLVNLYTYLGSSSERVYNSQEIDVTMDQDEWKRFVFVNSLGDIGVIWGPNRHTLLIDSVIFKQVIVPDALNLCRGQIESGV